MSRIITRSKVVVAKMPISNPIISAQLKAFTKFFSYDESRESENFEKYSIFSAINGSEGLKASPEDFHIEGDDFGIDGVGIVVNGEVLNSDVNIENFKKITEAEVFCFQSKTSSSLSYGEIAKFFDGVSDYISGKMKSPSEELKLRQKYFVDLMDNATKFSNNPSLNMYYIYTGSGEISSDIQTLIDSRRDYFDKLSIFSTIKVNIIGAAPLQIMHRRASEVSESVFTFSNKTTLPEYSGVSEAYIGFIPASELINIIAVSSDKNKINRKLFFDNVRDYDPDSDVNKSINESLNNDPMGFVFRNNGITIVARSGRPTGNNFKIEDFQIVNGCQTSNIIFNNLQNLEKVQVPLRLVISNDNAFINTIIVGTNRQNPVRDEQFWALKPFAKNFEEYVRAQDKPRDLYYERRDNQYRFDEVTERTRIIDSSMVVKAVVSMFLKLPNRAGRDYRQIKNEFGDVIFRDDHNVRIYHVAAYAFYRLEFYYRTKRIDISLKKYRMYILWAIAQRLGPLDDIFQLKEKDVNTYCESLLEFLDDDGGLSKFINDFVVAFEGALSAKGQSHDRDALRAEENLSSAKTAMEGLTNPILVK